MKLYEELKNDITYLKYMDKKNRIIRMLQEDDFDVEHLRILLYLLEEDKRVLDMLLTQTQNPIPTAIDAEDIRALFRNKDEVTTDASDR